MKRLFDILAASLGLMLTVPFYPLIALAIKIDSLGDIFYLQVRVGLNGMPFNILKFRTMVTNADRHRHISVKGDHRVTRFGKFLRRFEIDELPTLINVLKGDMSIVGPRPEIPNHVQHFTSEQRRVLSVRPGVTDLGTLQFRNEGDLLADNDHVEDIYLGTILPDKLRLNLEYIDRQSFIFDLRIIFATLYLIIRQRKG